MMDKPDDLIVELKGEGMLIKEDGYSPLFFEEKIMDLTMPTGDQCSEKTKVYEDKNSIGYAIWYPQMGGYVGKAIAVCDKKWEESETFSSGGCVEIYIWHDGEFPFNGKDGRKPIHLHLCCPQQFIRFGQEMIKLNNKGRIKV